MAGSSGDGGPAVEASLHLPVDLAFDAEGNLYIADSWAHRIRKLTPDGLISTVGRTGARGFSCDGGPAAEARLSGPAWVRVDSAGNLYIADQYNNRIRRISADGVITTVAGIGYYGAAGHANGEGGPAAEAMMQWPEAVAIAPDGALYVADNGADRVRRITADGKMEAAAGARLPAFNGDGLPATEAVLRYPYGLAVDSSGALYIADTIHCRILKVDPEGVIATVAGSGRDGHSGDGGPAVLARLALPMGLALDAQGNLYIADYLNRRVRRVSPDGIITTVAGDGQAGYSGDGGPAPAAQLDYPHGVAVDAEGRLYVSDIGSHVVRRIWLGCQPGPVLAFRNGQGALELARPAEGRQAPFDAGAGSGVAVALDGRGLWLAAIHRGDGSLSLLREKAEGASETPMPWEPDAEGTPALAVAHPAAGRRAAVAFRTREGLLRAGFLDLDENQPGEAVLLERFSPVDPATVSCSDGSLFVLATDEEGRLWSRRWRAALGWEEWNSGPAGIDGPFSAVCGASQTVYVAARDLAGWLLLARLNGNRREAAALLEQDITAAPQLASAVNGRLYLAYADRDGILQLAEFLEQRQEVFSRWNTAKAAQGFALVAVGGAPWLLAWNPDEPVSAYDPATGQWRPLDPEVHPSGPVAAAPR